MKFSGSGRAVTKIFSPLCESLRDVYLYLAGGPLLDAISGVRIKPVACVLRGPSLQSAFSMETVAISAACCADELPRVLKFIEAEAVAGLPPI